MANPAIQLQFTLRTSPNVRTVHLLGSWDNYKSQLPLSSVLPSKDNPSVKPGSWRGTFRFQGSHALKLGSRYWYYYIVDGYHVSHDPAKEHVTEPTTGRILNVLDVPGGPSAPVSRGGATVSTTSVRYSTATNPNRHSRDIPQGRALSPGKILHPKPSKPYASRQLREADYDASPLDGIEDLAEELGQINVSGMGRHISPTSSSSGSSSPDDDDYGSSSRDSSSPSSLSSLSSGSCRCERYGITRRGERVKLDCGGARCGYTSSSSSECSSEQSSDASDSEEDQRPARGRHELEAAKAREREAALRREKEREIAERAKASAKAKSRHAAPAHADKKAHGASSRRR